MDYNFEQRWRGLIKSGAKQTTFRAERKDGRKPREGGDFRAVVFPYSRKRREVVHASWIVEVVPVVARAARVHGCAMVRVWFGGKEIGLRWVSELARGDGFEGAKELCAYLLPGRRRLFRGWWVRWHFPQRTSVRLLEKGKVFGRELKPKRNLVEIGMTANFLNAALVKRRGR